MTILVAVPTYDDNVSTETYKSIFDMIRSYQGDVDLEFVKGYSADHARNKIGHMTLDGGYSHVLMVDSDVKVPKDTIPKLLDPPADIVLGLYYRKDDCGTVMFKEGPGNFDSKKIIRTHAELSDRRTKIKGGGLGCALISSHVFEVLDAPWFKYVTYSNGSVLSEDLFFCEHATLNGIDVWLDRDVRCGHRKIIFV